MNQLKEISDRRFHESRYLSTVRDDGQKCPTKIDEETGEITQKSAAFYAYNKQNYKNKLQLAMKNPVANSIFEFFVSEMDNTNAIVVSMQTLEQLFKLKRNAISKHIKYLVENKFITVFKVGNMNAYAVNAYVVWTQGDANLYKAKFAATMYLNYDEQTPRVKAEFSKKISNK
jgi:DNA-binding transcriptional ArsR family regulator